MQKFVKLNNHPTNIVEEQTRSSLNPSQVKLVGYLKKKRTKVGGWRKMWFVLQNQLLLSYPSKEDYDKKLVSFKDVLNLVPGTVVRPLGGYRFAIQTTSESVFIFRCDDNKTYMEWITALVDSLSIGSKTAKLKDGYGGAMTKRPLQGSHSCSSLVRSKKNKSVHMPIVHGTARILNRTGLSENDLRAFSLRENNERSNHFCLHENQFHLQNQSNEVSRINRMFCGSSVSASSDADTSSTTVLHPTHITAAAATGNGDKGFTQPTLTTLTLPLPLPSPSPLPEAAPAPAPSSSSSSSSSSSKKTKATLMKAQLSGLKGGNQCESESCEVNHNKSVINRKIHDFINFIKTDSSTTMIEDNLSESDFARDINANRRCDLKKILDKERKVQNQNTGRNTRIEDQVQRLSLQGSSAFKIDDRKNIQSMDEEVNCLRLSSTIRRKDERSPFCRQHRKRTEAGCTSLSSGSCSSSGRTIESLSPNDNGSEIIEDVGDANKKNEPIYAVVDLKNKYEHRARMRHEMEEKRKSRLGQINDLDEVTTDYEEVFDFPNESFENTINHPRHCYDEENIYEPINIPDPPFRDHKHRNVLWKYISRLNMDALFELARNRKKTVKPSSEQSSPFANIKQKIGHHRKSLRIRMIKLYARENHQNSEEIVEKIENDDDKFEEGQRT